MKFIGGPLDGKPLPEWVIEQRPVTVIVRASDDADQGGGEGWTGATKTTDHTYSRRCWRRGHYTLDVYAFHLLSDDEVDKFVKKAFV